MGITEKELGFLQEKAAYIRKKICITANKLGVIHLGGLLSSTDIMVALYYKYLDFDPNDLNNPNRNKFILSKGHCAVLIYSILCDLGIYDWNDFYEKFKLFSHQIWQHTEYRKGIEVPTGSLGHGLSIATGIALANRDNQIKSRIYCLVGDGEMHEGSNWEAIMHAGSHNISNLVCIVDFNQCTASFRHGDNIQFDWKKAFSAFGWDVKLVDGGNMHEITEVIESLPKVSFTKKSKPVAIIAKTNKGHCIDFMSGPAWHFGSLDDDKLKQAIECIDKNLEGRKLMYDNVQ